MRSFWQRDLKKKRWRVFVLPARLPDAAGIGF
jgi:hypothetical protein